MDMNQPRGTRQRTEFGRRMLQARQHAKLSQPDVCKRLGMGQSTLVDIESKANKSGYTAQLADLYAVPALWLAEGTGPLPNWLSAQHANEGLASYTVAHAKSQPQSSDDLPYLSWESLMGNVPDSLFVLVLRDDALGSKFPRGTAVVWSKSRRPAPGRLVLVRDKHGRDHARMYQEHPEPGAWTAAALNPAFASFDPREDGLTVLAVHRGVLEPEDAEES